LTKPKSLFLQTRSGKRIYFYAEGTVDFRADHICDEDVAYGLAHTWRWRGFAWPPMTVAEHCWRASYVDPEKWPLEKLLHDGAEYLTGDFVSPMKLTVPEFKERIEKPIETEFRRYYNLDTSEECHREVKRVDHILYSTEIRDLMGGPGWPRPEPPMRRSIVPMPRRLAEAMFLARLDELLGRVTLRRYWLGVVPGLQWIVWRGRSLMGKRPARFTGST